MTFLIHNSLCESVLSPLSSLVCSTFVPKLYAPQSQGVLYIILVYSYALLLVTMVPNVSSPLSKSPATFMALENLELKCKCWNIANYMHITYDRVCILL